MCYSLAESVMDSGKDFDAIVTISRGGLIPARIVSDVLGIDEFYTVRSKFWGIGGRIAPEPLVKMYEGVDVKGRDVLVVDEVVDTGATMAKVVRLLRGLGAKNIRTAVLHYKSTSSFIPNYFVEKVDHWVWIFYPWSFSETLYELSRRRGGELHESAKALLRELGVEDVFMDEGHLRKSLDLYGKRESQDG
ncbi:MAG: phosphoribosyltransferase [Desulfurococcales archaeon]|nr:phosphoribosyltransferase [Desulfurococcales archaeon]